MRRARRSRLAGDERGAAALEFALISVFFFGLVSVGLDFGAYASQKLKLGSVVEQAAIIAFNTRETIDPAAIAAYVKTAAGLAATPAVTCNGMTCAAAASRGATDYRCINQTNGEIDTAAKALGDACAGGGIAGYYLKIAATKTYAATIVPDRYLNNATMAQTALVRLQ